MATADIKKLSVYDPRIVAKESAYAVQKGGLSYTVQPTNAISASASQMTFNVQVPSLNVFVDRSLDWTATTLLALTVNMNAVVSPYVLNQPVLTFGKDVALCALPLNSMLTTIQATINDCSITINSSDVLKEVLRLTDYKKNRLMRTAPAMLDKYASYNDAYLAVNSPLASYLDATEPAEVPNGAWWNIQFTDSNGVALVGAGNYVVGAQAYAYVDGIPVRNTAVYAADAVYPVFVQFSTTEKIVLSPFIFADSHEYDQGLYGISSIQLVMNIGAQQISRLIRSTTANGRTIASCVLQNYSAGGSPFQNARINTTYITPSLDLKLPEVSSVQYLEFPRYISNNYSALPAGATTTIQSQTLTLSQIPDMFLFYVKPTSYSATNGDFYMPILNLNLTFDNFSGLMATYSPEQLYQMSVHNGLEMDFNQWRGYARSAVNGANIQSTGGFLVVRPGQDYALQSGQAPGSLGQYTVQATLQIQNTSSAPLTPVLYIVTVNSGYIQSMAGSTRVVKGILSEADVLEAPPAEPMGADEMARAVGSGGFLDKIGSFLSKASDIYKQTKPIVSAVKGVLPESGALGKVKGMLGSVGYGGAAAPPKKSLSQRLM